MSLITIRRSFGTFAPKVRVEDSRLIASTSALSHVCRLFFSSKTVVVDKAARLVTIQRRLFWGWNSTSQIPFQRIRRIDYAYAGWQTWRDEWERYRVGLVLTDPDEDVHLFTFSGEGAKETGWKGVLLGDSLIDYMGEQDIASRRYVDLLEEFTGASLL